MRRIKLTQDIYDSVLRRIIDDIQKESQDKIAKAKDELSKVVSGQQKCSKYLNLEKSSDEDCVYVYMTSNSYVKMQSLVAQADKEIGWYGTVDKVGDNSYVITDILVPPQEVTGATVTCEDNEFAEWKQGLDDDTFNKLRFHGHSHVNMGVTPSGTDENFQTDTVSQLGGNDFYIFLIVNKRGDMTVRLYDIQKNVMYEQSSTSKANTEIVFDVCKDDGSLLSDWMSESLKNVRNKTSKVVSVVPAKAPTTAKVDDDLKKDIRSIITPAQVRASMKGVSYYDAQEAVDFIEDQYEQGLVKDTSFKSLLKIAKEYIEDYIWYENYDSYLGYNYGYDM